MEKKPPTLVDIEIKDLTINSFKIALQIWILRFGFQFEFLTRSVMKHEDYFNKTKQNI